MFTVVKAISRDYGYTIKAPSGTAWVIGPGGTFGWYKRKVDAQQRADVLNAASAKAANKGA